jgi:hypothetical protein
MLDGGADKIDAVGTVLLQIEYELGREGVGKRLEDGGCFLIYLLDRPFDFMTVGIRSCVSNVSLEKTERSGERETNSLRIRTECFDLMASRTIDSNELL